MPLTGRFVHSSVAAGEHGLKDTCDLTVLIGITDLTNHKYIFFEKSLLFLFADSKFPLSLHPHLERWQSGRLRRS